MTEPQNIYDDERFFGGYSQMERFGTGWEQALEQPEFVALLPALAGVRALDLGCGVGQLAHYLAASGAAEVIGVDVSQRMLDLARAERSHPRLRYARVAIEDVRFPPRRFELVVSSLAFHYVADYRGLVQRIAEWLVPGGTLVFSTEHPIYTARLPDLGWIDSPRGGWAIDWYSDEGERVEHWFVEGVRKQHRTMATLVNELIDAGLQVERVLEPAPSGERLERRPHELEHRRRPMFVMLKARRGTCSAG